MDNDNGKEGKDAQQIIIQSCNYNVTVVPMEFSVRNRMCHSQDIGEPFGYCQDPSLKSYSHSQWSNDKVVIIPEIKKEHHGFPEYNDNQLTQRLPSIATGYSHDGNYCQDIKPYAILPSQWSNDKSYSGQANSNEQLIYEEICDSQPKSATNGNPAVIVNNNGGGGIENGSHQIPESFEGPVIPMCVYLHNKTVIMMEIEDTPSATSELICQAIINCDELGLNKVLAMQVFALWMISPLLELQLKPYSKPYEIRQNWRSFVERYGHASDSRMDKDEPKLVFQRNTFLPRALEEKIKDQRILELLYEECKYNILNGRYPSEIAHLIMLGSIQAREELGPYNPQVHSTHFFREEQSKFLPAHVRKSPTWTWLPISSKNSAEVRLLEQFKRIPSTATNRKLIKKYLEYCWGLPFYGAAFFEGQIEEPVRGLISLLTHQDIPVLIAINSRGLYIIDDSNCEVILGLRYEEFSWDCSKPPREDNPDCLPCLFVQFLVVENGARVSKMLQVFSKQAGLMDRLINTFVSQLGHKANDETNKMYDAQNGAAENGTTETDNPPGGNNGGYPSGYSALSNKLNKLTLATFDEDGRCIGQMGSWSFGY